MDTSIKSLGDNRFGGYLVIWGSAAQKDLTGEYFTKSTDLALNMFNQRPALYHHGLNPKVGNERIGVIDTLTPDETGLWAAGEYEKRNKYTETIKRMVESGALSWSSGSLPHLVAKKSDGEITKWPIVEGSFTPTPAEPRGTQINATKHFTDAALVATAYKSIGLSTDLLELPQEAPDATTDQNIGDGYDVGTSTEDSQSTQSIKFTTGELIMDPKEIAKIVAEQIALADAARKSASDAQLAQEAAINTEVERRIAAKAAAAKPLPPPDLPATTRIDVTRASKYSHLSASGMGFMAEVLASGGKSLSEGFLRELADKSFKAVERGDLPQDAVKGLNDLGFLKANELNSAAQSGFGSEWAPDSWRASLWERVRQDNMIAPQFEMIDMPTNPYELPIESTDPTVSYVPETTDQVQEVWTSGNPIPQSKIGTGKVQMSAKKLALRMAWSAELGEDSILPIADRASKQSIRAMQDAIDNVLMNGDTVTSATTNINNIAGTPTSTDKFLAFNGIRKFGLVTNTAQKLDFNGAAPTLALIRQMRFKLHGGMAVSPKNLVLFADDSTYAKLLSLPEFVTDDKTGGMGATNMTGVLGKIDGIPVITSYEMALTNSAGKYDVGTPANDIYGTLALVYTPNWLIGYRRQVQALVEKIAAADIYHLTVSARLCLVSQSVKDAVIGFDIGV